MLKKITIASLAFLISLSAFATQYFVAPTGNDLLGTGTMQLPFQTIQKAQTFALAGDTVYVRGGNYVMTEAQIASYSSIWAYVTLLNKSGTSGRRINYWAYPGEKPVFDYSNIKPAGYRINAFEVTGSWIHIKGLEVIGVQVTITDANTQSICFSNNGGSNNIYEMLSMHDGQAIGFYLTRGANNLILNCDAYRNYDYTSRAGGGVNGGNVDGFGNHPNSGGVNNVFRGCRAWFNSDDGYDCISAHETTVFENCWAFYNGYSVGFVSRGDGNGFKVGGYGSTAFNSLPANIPRNITRFCLSVRNKSSGFYANHHLEGGDWYNNSAYLNATNYNMLSRKAKTQADYLTDVPGYNHSIRNNISLSPRSSANDITNYDAARCVITNNTFLSPGITVSANDFESLDTALLTAPRQPDGSLPVINFMRLKATSNLVDKGADIGFPYTGAAPDLGCFEFTSNTLPVGLLLFNAGVQGITVTLTWKTSLEIQNKGWDIERLDGTATTATWKKIGFVAGKGASNRESSYSFKDKVSSNTYTYRLKQLDVDGNIKYSAVRTVVIKAGTTTLSVFPNPVVSTALVDYTLHERSQIQLSVVNSSGQTVALLVNAFRDAGAHKQPIDENLIKVKGSYIIKLAVNGVVTTQLITKM